MFIATLSLLAVQAASVAPPACGCAQYATGAYATAPPVASAQARAIRDFALYTHRKIADELVRGQGPYLDNLLPLLAGCAERERKIAWLRQLALSAADTDAFADRIARTHEAAQACARPSPMPAPVPLASP